MRDPEVGLLEFVEGILKVDRTLSSGPFKDADSTNNFDIQSRSGLCGFAFVDEDGVGMEFYNEVEGLSFTCVQEGENAVEGGALDLEPGRRRLEIISDGGRSSRVEKFTCNGGWDKNTFEKKRQEVNALNVDEDNKGRAVRDDDHLGRTGPRRRSRARASSSRSSMVREPS